MKKTFTSVTLLFAILISTGCAMNENGYGVRGQLPGDLQAVQSAQQNTSANDPAFQQLVEMNKNLMMMLQKQNGQQSATVQPPAVMKLTPESLGEKKTPAPTTKPKAKKVKKPAVSAAPATGNGLEKRISAVEDAVDDLQSRMDLNHPGQDVSKVKFSASSSTLTQADKNKLYTEVIKSWFEGKINILGIAVYDKADANIADMRYTEMMNFVSSYGIPRTLLGEKTSKKAAVNGDICHVIWTNNDPSVVEVNRKERQAYRVDIAPSTAKPN
ncbi:MAG: hypothetical protein BWY51_00613 [Parcubacteria group bacterium ADurb.Bin316]|nr:MAG: hypothetical protein BWY51_00613 [Parcubacteria group bacterium ADurb.Bin316]